jgi:transposase
MKKGQILGNCNGEFLEEENENLKNLIMKHQRIVSMMTNLLLLNAIILAVPITRRHAIL